MKINQIETIEDLRKYLNEYKLEKGQHSLHRAIQNSKTLQNLLKNFTISEEDLSFSARSYLVANNINRPSCAVCGEKTEFNLNKREFLECCSVKCAANNPRRNEQIEKTNLEKYGNKNFWGSKEHQDNLTRQSIEKYGIDHYFKSQDFKEKTEITSLEKYGTKFPVQSLKVRKLLSDIRNSSDKKMIYQKCKETWKKKYGVTHPFKVPEIFEKQQKNSYYRKDYHLPSGRKIQLQGFEPQCLDILLKTYSEDEILLSVKEIFATLGPIDYIDKNGINRRYFPDFYIPCENKIIEVKSARTYSVHKELNESKRAACIERGMKFEFWIFGPEGLEIISYSLSL